MTKKKYTELWKSLVSDLWEAGKTEDSIVDRVSPLYPEVGELELREYIAELRNALRCIDCGRIIREGIRCGRCAIGDAYLQYRKKRK